MDDNLYPRDGSDYQAIDDTATYYDQPLEQKEADAKLNAIQKASFPIMGDVADWFEQEIDSLDSRQKILEFAKYAGVTPEVAGYAFDVARDILAAKAIEFEQYRHER